MPKEQADWIIDTQLYCLNATNMTEDEAYNFAFRCWQLGFEKKKHTIRETKADTVRKMQERLKDHLHRDRYVARLID